MKVANVLKIMITLVIAAIFGVGSACVAQLTSVGVVAPPAVKLCGDIIGLSMYSDGLIVEESAGVLTANGLVDTTARCNIRKGDILKKIANYAITTAKDVSGALREIANGKNALEVSLLRGNSTIKTRITPAVDQATGEYKLGLWTRDHTSGIGTLTYILPDGKFGALGHGVSERQTYFPVSAGDVYPAEILGVKKGENGQAGSIQGTFSYHALSLGNIMSNGLSGIRGKTARGFDGISAAFGGKERAKAGKAEIISCINGTRKRYAIEIIRTRAQSRAAEKSMVLRVTDPELLELTGGIVQGMSGSPIIQNGFWIGAVTHVFNSSPREGYAIYADWML